MEENTNLTQVNDVKAVEENTNLSQVKEVLTFLQDANVSKLYYIKIDKKQCFRYHIESFR